MAQSYNSSMQNAENAVEGMIEMIRKNASRLVQSGAVYDMNEMAAQLAVVARAFEGKDVGDDYGVELLKKFGL